MEERLNDRKISLGQKIGYAIGGGADTIPYYLFGTYFLFFATDVVGLPAGIAGTISFVAIVCQAIAGPIIAYISDNSLNPKGRRRPFMMKIAIPFSIVVALLFLPIGGGVAIKAIYYGVLAILFYIFYAAWISVWPPLGAEMTDDYEERNNIRSIVAYAGIPLGWVASSGTIMIVGWFSGKGMDYGRSWFVAAIILAVIVFLCALITWKTTTENPPKYTEEERAELKAQKFSLKELILEYLGYFKIKVYRKVILFTFIFVTGYIMMNNGTVYAMTSVVGMNEAQQALFWTLNLGISLVCIPIVFGIANKWGKKQAMMLFVGVYGASSVVWFILGLFMHISFGSFLAFSGCVALGTTAFYSLLYSLLYDCTNVNTLATGEQREGGMLALQYLAQTLGGALAALLLGWGLQFGGYTEAAAISHSTMLVVWALVTIVPAILVAISMIFLGKYNLSRKKYERVIQAIADRDEGKEIDLSEFDDII